MKKRRGKHKRGKKGATEDEVNSAKKPNMKAGDGKQFSCQVYGGCQIHPMASSYPPSLPPHQLI